MKRLNIKAMKKAHDNGMPIKEIVEKVNRLLEGLPLVNVLDTYYKEIDDENNSH